MKFNLNLTRCVVAFLALAAPAVADGPTGDRSTVTDPVVAAPRDAWTGPYVGLAYGRAERTEEGEDVRCLKLGQPRACDDPIFDYYPEYKEEVRTAWSRTVDVDRAGLLAGYRWDTGLLVPGVEVALYDDGALPGAQLGLDLGGALAYAHVDRDGPAVGLDLRASPRLTVGARASDGAAALTVKWGF